MSHTVSILLPCLNEESYIAKCLADVRSFELPVGVEIEILVLDGRSSDRTRELAEHAARSDSRIRVLDNPGRIQSTAINIGIRVAKGEWIMRLDAHSYYPSNYLRLCWETSQRTGADNVGGIFITQPGGNSYSAQLVQALTTHKFGVGDSGFRTGAKEDWADTVPYGFFRRDVFERIGYLDERLIRAQDYEFNRRLIVSGGRILRNPNIHIYYHNQPNLYAFYRKQILKEAPFNAYLWYVAPYAFAMRHAITAGFAAGVLGGLASARLSDWIAFPFYGILCLYFVLAVLAGIQQGIRYKIVRHVFLLPFCFFLYHFIHGIGVWYGVVRLVFGISPVQSCPEPWPGAGRRRAWSRSVSAK